MTGTAKDPDAPTPDAAGSPARKRTSVSAAQIRPQGLWPLANPRRIRLTAPGNPVHR